MKWCKDVVKAAEDKQLEIEKFMEKANEKSKQGVLCDQAKIDAQAFAQECLNEDESKYCSLEVPKLWDDAFKLLQAVREEHKAELIQRRKKMKEDK